MADIVGVRDQQVAAGGMYLFTVRDRVFEAALNDGRVRMADIRMSVNRKVVTDDVALSDGDEVAFFSVFSGG
ncbi:MAG: MoaD/ThiS family protein [Asticcacaulis sp.]|nr:MoaD/ThiS family protein [Asticcacaulis sp.]